MKKLFYIILLIVFQNQIFGQAVKSDSVKTKLRPYLSMGVSIGNVDAGSDNFNKASYPSFEAGVMGENLSLGAVFGCENFFVTSASREFYELKTSLSKS